MNRTLFVWQFDNWPIANIPAAAAAQGFTRLAVKALDGADWMSTYDRSSDAVSGVDSLKDWQSALFGRNLALDVWVVPTPDSLSAAIPLYREIMAALPSARLIFDLEPYAGFWGPSSLDPFWARYDFPFEQTALCFDPRRPEWVANGVTKTLARWLMPMTYGESGDWIDPLRSFEGYGVWEPIVSTDNDVSVWSSILNHPRLGSRAGRSGFGVWRAPLSRDDQVAFVRGHS